MADHAKTQACTVSKMMLEATMQSRQTRGSMPTWLNANLAFSQDKCSMLTWLPSSIGSEFDAGQIQ